MTVAVILPRWTTTMPAAVAHRRTSAGAGCAAAASEPLTPSSPSSPNISYDRHALARKQRTHSWESSRISQTTIGTVRTRQGTRRSCAATTAGHLVKLQDLRLALHRDHCGAWDADSSLSGNISLAVVSEETRSPATSATPSPAAIRRQSRLDRRHWGPQRINDGRSFRGLVGRGQESVQDMRKSRNSPIARSRSVSSREFGSSSQAA